MSPRGMLMDIPTGRFQWASLLGTAKWPWDISIDSCPSVGLGGRPRGSRDLEQLRAWEYHTESPPPAAEAGVAVAPTPATPLPLFCMKPKRSSRNSLRFGSSSSS